MTRHTAQFFPFRPVRPRKQFQITYEKVIAAMETASRTGNAAPSGTKYAVMNPRTGRTFSPKLIVGLALGPGRRDFYGGKGERGANSVFRTFGFPVGNQRALTKRWNKLIKSKRRIPATEALLSELFRQRWALLPAASELRGLKGGRFPGVYVLAYSQMNLKGKRVREEDVFYVGMTCEGGLASRLWQFRMGIAHGGFHSAAKRFHRIWLRRKLYNPNGALRLYFACVPVECETVKEWRSPRDIAILSKVPELELRAISRIKARIHHEPLLNKK